METVKGPCALVPPIIGKVRFDGPNNYGVDMMRIKHVQNQKWVIVYPDEFKTPGSQLIIK
jgi:branched-chain amino acid transport system substrate-binding protein